MDATRVNMAMRRLLRENDISYPWSRPLTIDLHPDLEEIVRAGFHRDGEAYLLTAFKESVTGFSRDVLPDTTGLECLSNHLHFADFLERDEATPNTRWQLRQALAFARSLCGHWHLVGNSLVLRVIVAEGEGDVTIRCHVLRANEVYLDEDLEEYETESILVIDCDSRT